MTSNLKGIENGRAEFAYKCAEQIILLKKELVCFDFQSAYPIKNEEKEHNKKIIEEFFNNPKEYAKAKKKDGNDFEKKIISKYLKDQDEYKSYAKNIPMMIKTNGIGATFAFIKSKNKTAYDLIYRQINIWLQHNNCPIKIEGDLLVYLVNTQSYNYRAVTIEVLAFFTWLRRFAEGLIEDKEGNIINE